MKLAIKIAGLAASLVIGGVSASQAAVIDFTSNTLTATATGFEGTTLVDIDWTIDGVPPSAVLGDSVNASIVPTLNALGMAGNHDGIGIDDDEVNMNQTLVLTFSKDVKINTAYFLDLFQSEDGSSFEQVTISNGVSSVVHNAEVTTADPDGFGSVLASLIGNSFTFTSTGTNDNQGLEDFALAGLHVTAVPLPAGLLLLGSAFGGLGMVRRRSKK